MSQINTLLNKFSFTHSSDVYENQPDETQIPVSDVISPNPNKESVSFKKKSGPESESVIAEDLVVDGNITSRSNITVYGIINGNLKCEGNVNVHGEINGNVNGASVSMSNSQVKGDITADMKISINPFSSVTGSLSASDASISGAVEGNITVDNLLTVGNSAVVTGDISSSKLSVVEGAVINGNVRIVKPQ